MFKIFHKRSWNQEDFCNRRDPFNRTAAVYVLFLPTFHLFLQPSTTQCYTVLSPNTRQLLLISSWGDATKWSCWFTKQNLVPSTPAPHCLRGLRETVTGEIHHTLQTHHGVGEDWAVTSAYPPTKPSATRVLAERKYWCTDIQSQLTKGGM